MKIDVLMNERVFVVIDGLPKRYLGPGRHTVFAPFNQVRVERVSTQNLFAELDADRLALVPAEDLTLVTNAPHERAVVYRKGRAAAWLGAGTHQIWTVERAIDRATKAVVPLVRVDAFDVSGVATRPLKDDVKAIASSADYVEVTAPAGTVALRFVNGVLDAELPSGRHAAFTAIEKVTFAVIDLKERLLHVGLKDIVLPGEMKELLNKVIGAQKEAEANVIFRREETAATRSMAQTAKVLSENPLLVRLKELEAYKDLAHKVGQVHLVLGESALPKLELKR